MMAVYRLCGTVDGAKLRAELEAAFGPPASDRWWPVFDPNQAVITYNDMLFTPAAIASVVQTHCSPAAVQARSAAAPISLKSLAASDPEVVKIVNVLRLGGLLKE